MKTIYTCKGLSGFYVIEGPGIHLRVEGKAEAQAVASALNTAYNLGAEIASREVRR